MMHYWRIMYNLDSNSRVLKYKTCKDLYIHDLFTDYESIDESTMDAIVKVPELPERRPKHMKLRNLTKLPESDRSNPVELSVVGKCTRDVGPEINFTDGEPNDECKNENSCSSISEQLIQHDVEEDRNEADYEIPYSRTSFIVQNDDDAIGGNEESVREAHFKADTKLLIAGIEVTQDRCAQFVVDEACVNLDLFPTTAKMGYVEGYDVAESTENEADSRNNGSSKELHVVQKVPIEEKNLDYNGYEIPCARLDTAQQHVYQNILKHTAMENKQGCRSNDGDIGDENLARPRIDSLPGNKGKPCDLMSRKGIVRILQDTHHHFPSTRGSVPVDDDGYEIPFVS